MSGGFAVVSRGDCVAEVFYGTDFNSHLGKSIGGMAIFNGGEIKFDMKGIGMFPFRPQMEGFMNSVKGKKGLGIISDNEPQPLFIESSLGEYAIAHIGKVDNLDELVRQAHQRGTHFSSARSGKKINPTEVVASLINCGTDYVDGVKIMQNSVEGSSSVMLLTPKGVIVARDKYGRTPIGIARREDGTTAASSESCAFKNLAFKFEGEKFTFCRENAFRFEKSLGPGEIGIITEEGYEQLKESEEKLQLCTFLLVYYGNPASNFEGINAEIARNALGGKLASVDKAKDLIKKLDFVAGIPDSGIGSALGYSRESGLPYLRPFVKYTETWQRSFMPQNQAHRALVAQMKLLPIEEIIRGKNIMSNDDSLVRGTQSEKKFEILRALGAQSTYLRLSCPPLMFACPYLNFSISESVFELGARRAIEELEGSKPINVVKYLNETGAAYEAMVARIGKKVGVDSLGYQGLNEMLEAIGLPKEKACTTCWDGCKEGCK